MSWDLDNTRPIYMQLIERIEQNIITGIYKPGDKLPSVRDFAMQAAVNPNTMQKALSELEQMGLVYTKRTSGRFITEDEEMIQKMKAEIALEKVKDFLEKMHSLGFTNEEILNLIKSNKEEGVKDE